MLEAFRQPQRDPAGERMVRRHDGADPVVEADERAQPRIVRQVVGERKIRFPADHGADRRVARQRDDAKLDAGVVHPESLDDSGQEAPGDAGGRHDGDLTAPQALERLDAGAHPLVILQGLADMADQHLARGRQPQAARQALEDRRSDLLLEHEDLPIDRRRRHVEAARGLPDRAAARHFIQVTQNTGVHLASSDWRHFRQRLPHRQTYASV